MLEKHWLLKLILIASVLEPASQVAAQENHVRWSGSTPTDQEAFLRAAQPIRIQILDKGITRSRRATLCDGNLTHDAHLQSVDIWKAKFTGSRRVEYSFRDSYKFNVAAHLLDKLLGLDMVPATVRRRIQGEDCSVTWWVDDVLMDERERILKKLKPPDAGSWAKQIHMVRVFDALIYNTDRNQGNLLITKDWKVWMIDHTRAFRCYLQLPNSKILSRCEKGLLERLREIRQEDFEALLKPYLTRFQISSLLRRRDLLVEHFETLIRQSSEDTVLYTLD